MKVALVLSGQMRQFNRPDVIHAYFKYIIERFNCHIFISTWDTKGYSYHGSKTKDSDNIITIENIENVYSPHIKNCVIDDYEKWKNTLDVHKKFILDNGFVSVGEKIPGFVVPQLYKIWHGNKLKCDYERQNNFKYDLVIRSRPDNLFLYPMDGYLDNIHNSVYAINGDGHYFPNRIYDIFFYSNSENMDKIAEAYNNFEEIVTHPFQNGLNKYDACRMLFVQALICGLHVSDIPKCISIVAR